MSVTAAVTEATVMDLLDQVHDPCSVAAGRPMSLVDMGLVEQVRVDEDGKVHIALTLTSPSCMMLGQIMEQVDRLLVPLCGEAPKMTFDDGLSWTPDRIRGAAAEHRRERQAVLVQLSRRPDAVAS